MKERITVLTSLVFDIKHPPTPTHTRKEKREKACEHDRGEGGEGEEGRD